MDQLLAQIELMEQRAQQDRASSEPVSQNGSTSLLNVNTRMDEIGDVGEDQGDDDYASGDEYLNFSSQMQGSAPSRRASHMTITPRSNGVTRSEHDDLQAGSNVILYALLRYDQPIAKGTIISTNPSVILGDQPLGTQFCEVIVTCVLKRDAILPRPYLNMDTMADAHMMNIAWPYKKLKVCNKAPTPPASGSGGRRFSHLVTRS